MEEKLARVRGYLREKGYTGAVFARQDNFNWITGGGNSRVIVPRDAGHAAVVVTEEQVFLVAQWMDGPRIMDEEMAHLAAEPVFLHWYEASVPARAVELAGARPVCDLPGIGGEERLSELYDLHFPLTDEEYRTLRHVGALSDAVLTRVAGRIAPGMTDYAAEAMILEAFAEENAQCDVVLIGTEERMFHYRHPNPCGRKLGKYVMLHAAVRWHGLHSNVSRSVYFGDSVPEEIARPYEAACRIEAFCMSQCVTGRRWAEILAGQKQLYAELGYDGEWKCHYPGGRTGYFVSQSDLSLDPARTIQNREAYDFFVTATGAKVEELSVNWDGRHEILSHTGLWPSKCYSSNERDFELPQILLR